MTSATARFVFKNPIHTLAFGFGSGLASRAPGTVGTFAALPIWYLMSEFFSFGVLAAIVAVAFLLGIWICGYTSRALGVHDHGGIVWDEFVGLWLTLLFLPATFWSLVVGFMFFRLFDIWKPWPISFLDKHVHGGLGIMLDDVLAALPAAGLSLALLHLFTRF